MTSSSFRVAVETGRRNSLRGYAAHDPEWQDFLAVYEVISVRPTVRLSRAVYWVGEAFPPGSSQRLWCYRKVNQINEARESANHLRRSVSRLGKLVVDVLRP